MQKIGDVITEIERDWLSQPEADVCKKIVNFIFDGLNRNIKPNSVIRYSRLRQVIGHSHEEVVFLRAVSYLSGMKVHLLDRQFELIDGTGQWEITEQVDAHARTGSPVFHPETGDEISDFEGKVFLYFRPNPDLFLKATDNLNSNDND